MVFAALLVIRTVRVFVQISTPIPTIVEVVVMYAEQELIVSMVSAVLFATMFVWILRKMWTIVEVVAMPVKPMQTVSMEPVSVSTRPVVQAAARLVTPVRMASAVREVRATAAVLVWISVAMLTIVEVVVIHARQDIKPVRMGLVYVLVRLVAMVLAVLVDTMSAVIIVIALALLCTHVVALITVMQGIPVVMVGAVLLDILSVAAGIAIPDDI
jgi:hypothetical protein